MPIRKMVRTKKFVKSVVTRRWEANEIAKLERAERKKAREQKRIMEKIEDSVKKTGRVDRQGKPIISGSRYGEYYAAMERLKKAEAAADAYAKEINQITGRIPRKK